MTPIAAFTSAAGTYVRAVTRPRVCGCRVGVWHVARGTRACADSLRQASSPFPKTETAVSRGQVAQWLDDLDDGSATVRLRAVLGCKDLAPEVAAPLLCKVFDAGEKELQNRGLACLFLGYKPNPRSYAILAGIAENVQEPDEIRANAVGALGYLRDSRAVPLLLSFLRDATTHWSTRSSAAVSLGIIAEANPQISPIIYDDLVTALRLVDSADTSLVTSLCGALGDVRDVRAAADVSQFIDAADFTVAQCVCEALGKLPCKEAKRSLQDVIDAGDVHVNVLWAAELALAKVNEGLQL